MEAFYGQDKVGIEKLNLIEISKDLNIPKETVRRKVNYLQSNEIIIRSGKSIFLHTKGLEIQKPMSTIENLSGLLSKLSIKATKPSKGLENLCLASSTHLSYNFFNMNLKCTILRYLASLILSTAVIYAIVIVAGMFGADYGFSPGDTFIIWILMAILINQSVTWNK